MVICMLAVRFRDNRTRIALSGLSFRLKLYTDPAPKGHFLYYYKETKYGA